MQFSRYLKIYPSEDKPGYSLLFSTKRTSVLLLKDTIIGAIENGTLRETDEATLSDLGIIVHDRDEERLAMLHYLDSLNKKNRGMNLSVMLNLDCNFSCVYCYEKNIKGRHYMSDHTTDLLIKFIKERFTNSMKLLNIDFYGGEPLLSFGLITYISKAMKSLTEASGATYTFTLVSNGSLFKRRTAEELVRLGLSGIKITVDGPREVHNKYRPFKSGAGSFDAIIGNIKDTCDIAKIAVSGNFDESNYNAFPSLLDHLKGEGLTPQKLAQVKFDPVVNHPKGEASPTDYADGCMSINEPWLIKASAFLREETLRRGYFVPKPMPMPCQVEIDDSYVINHDGIIYKCPAFIGKEGFEIGDIQSGLSGGPNPYGPGTWKNDDCLGCEYLPLCFGGCRYMAYARDGRADGLDCRRPFFDAALETIIRQDIKYRRPLKKT